MEFLLYKAEQKAAMHQEEENSVFMPQMLDWTESSPGMNGCILIICQNDAASQEYLPSPVQEGTSLLI